MARAHPLISASDSRSRIGVVGGQAQLGQFRLEHQAVERRLQVVADGVEEKALAPRLLARLLEVALQPGRSAQLGVDDPQVPRPQGMAPGVVHQEQEEQVVEPPGRPEHLDGDEEIAAEAAEHEDVLQVVQRFPGRARGDGRLVTPPVPRDHEVAHGDRRVEQHRQGDPEDVMVHAVVERHVALAAAREPVQQVGDAHGRSGLRASSLPRSWTDDRREDWTMSIPTPAAVRHRHITMRLLILSEATK